MEGTFSLALGSFIFLIVFGLILINFIRGKPIVMREKCTCGQEKKWCKSYLYSSNSTLLGRKDRWLCKKNVDGFKEFVSHPIMKRIQKEIEEKGKSCPENW